MRNIIEELKKYKSICFYPSCGTDFSDIDYFCSGCLPREERKKESAIAEPWNKSFLEPEVFVHSDVNFYMEFEAGEELDLNEYGINSKYKILEFNQLETIKKPNRINNNLPFSGQIFEYKIKVWEKEKPIVLFFCLCENEYLISQIFLANKIPTWLARIAKQLGVKYFYTDWLCLPNFRGEPSNKSVYEKYPELKANNISKLERTDNHWIEEGAHGWVDEFVVI